MIEEEVYNVKLYDICFVFFVSDRPVFQQTVTGTPNRNYFVLWCSNSHHSGSAPFPLAPHPWWFLSEMSSLQQQPHGSTGSERDLHSAASSVSLPSVRKTPKKRRFSLQSLFGRRCRPDRETKRKAKTQQSAPDTIPGPESVQSEVFQDKNSAHSALGQASTSSVSGSLSDVLECPLCLLRHTRDCFPDIMTCHHRSCADCLRQYLRIEISESRVNISCPECSERFNPHDIQIILGDRALMEKYEEFMLRRWLVAEPDCRWCPAPDCG